MEGRRKGKVERREGGRIIDVCMDNGRMGRWLDGWISGWIDGWKNEMMEGWVGGRKEGKEERRKGKGE